jgi:hypothetical protein
MTAVREALAVFRLHAGLAPDQSSRRSWTCGLGPVVLELPNFMWRRRAIDRHDIHHVLTGYPCTLSGEIELAAWEFGAGHFPDVRATLFCLPLVAAGTIAAPRKTFAAFMRGRIGRSLYGRSIDRVLRSSLAQARRQMAPLRQHPASGKDKLAFALIAFQAFLLVMAPLLAASVAMLAI